jgi:YfiH family protein
MKTLPLVGGPEWPGVALFTTTREGGVGVAPYDTFNLGVNAGDLPEAVAENRKRLRAELPGEPLWLTQVHGAEVIDAECTAGRKPEPARADAAVTSRPDQVLAILTADCLPVAIADLDGRVLGMAHAGWRGLAAGVLENTLAAARGKHGAARGWRAWIGPAIGPRAFEVGADVYDVFTAEDTGAQKCFAPYPGRPGKWLADLPALAERRLRRAGVEQVLQSGLCTHTDAARFFSYRRDGATGRIATLAWLTAG